jgi:O-antigen/teichoic acid export membrane protein
MKLVLPRRIPSSLATSWPLISNALLLVSTTLLQSALGPLFWWAAARQFSPATVGLSSAAISAAMFLGTLAMLGLGTALMGELPQRRARAGSLVLGALSLSGGAGLLLGLLFVAIAPRLWAEFAPLSSSHLGALLFAGGASLTAVASVLDLALVGMLRSGLQFWRGVSFAVLKLLILVAIGASTLRAYSLSILLAHVVGVFVSLAVLGWLPELWRAETLRIDWGELLLFSRTALSHHLLNLTLQTPSMLLPILVTSLLSAESNASFYIAWMLSGVLYMAPVALTNVLFTIGAADPRAFAAKSRVTFTLSLVVGCVGWLVVLAGAKLGLALFGPGYAEQASGSMRLLAAGVFPLIVRQHYVALLRLQGRMLQAARLVVCCAGAQLGLAVIGAVTGGLAGLSLGFLLGLCIEAFLMWGSVRRLLLSTE